MATGSVDVIVALIDTAVDIDHPDIRPNLWTNPREISGNGLDDDGDGRVDDIHGWNFLDSSNILKPRVGADISYEAFIHGTAVASIIAGAGNNDIGISGVAWRAKLMPLVALSYDGYGDDGDVVAAIRYAVAHGADIINLSFMGAERDADLAQAIREATAQGVLVVSAAGNGMTRTGDDLDETPSYPACDKGAAGRGELTVTGLNADGRKMDYANYGSCVDVSAPGTDIFAARPTYDHRNGTPAAGFVGELSGTSVAAPMASGLAVLLKARYPHWTASEIAQRIIETADPVLGAPIWQKDKIGSGSINVVRALAYDESAARLGPLFVEASGRGESPVIRLLAGEGEEVARFQVGEGGDKRGIRAAFVRWTGGLEPEIVVAPMDDPAGSWRIYRLDGVLVAAGALGSDIRGGLFLAAQDLDGTGRDTLFLGEAQGNRAWLVSADGEPAREVPADILASGKGISALSVSSPVPAFFITSKFGGVMAIVGKNGQRLAAWQVTGQDGQAGWSSMRGLGQAGSVYDILTADGHSVFLQDAVGLRAAESVGQIWRWVQIPEGEPQVGGLVYYETWPR